MTLNEALARIYEIQPAIGVWARSGRPNVLWGSVQDARMRITEYIGPQASELVLGSLHIKNANRDFIRSWEALHAIWTVIDAIYNDRPIKDGFIPEDARR